VPPGPDAPVEEPDEPAVEPPLAPPLAPPPVPCAHAAPTAADINPADTTIIHLFIAITSFELVSGMTPRIGCPARVRLAAMRYRKQCAAVARCVMVEREDEA
jgi:hypothetical protein